MDRHYNNAQELAECGNFRAAAESFANSYKAGYLCKESLSQYGACKFFEAAYNLNGTGTISGLARRSVLISASKALRDFIDQYGEDGEGLFQLCAVEYALGLLLASRNGRTVAFDEIYYRLRDIDYKNAEAFNDFIPTIEENFT